MKTLLSILCCMILLSCEKDNPPPCESTQTFTLSFKNSGKVLVLGIDDVALDVTSIHNHEFTVKVNYRQVFTIELVWVKDTTGISLGYWGIERYDLKYQDGEWIRPNACATFNLWR